MKTTFSILFIILTSYLSFGQAQDPVTWSAAYRPTSDKEGEIVITATIQKGWHTYSQRPTDAGPIPTSFSFTPVKDITLKGKTEESGAVEEFVPAFEAKIFVFHDKAVFRQKIARKSATPVVAPVKVEYMSCNDMMCLPPKTATLQVKVQ
jgi:DsbC/DsbD-like thiol-disulfide interchange protein